MRPLFAPLLVLLLAPAAGLARPACQEAAPGRAPGIPPILLLPDGRTLPARDLRAWAARSGDDLAVLDPAAHAEFDRLFAAAVVRRAASVGLGPASSPALAALAARAAGSGLAVPQAAQAPPAPPPPGGVGYGTIFNNGALAWSQSTASYQRMIVPRRPGGDVTTWLYSTTTNRSELGVEAFVSYFAQQDFRFKVFDWARFPDSPWQTDIPYTALQDYLQAEAGSDGVWRQEIYVVNETFDSGAGTWTNRVWLENRRTGTMDVMYQFTYTAAPAANTYEPGDGFGWWGPIFETFQDHDGSNKPIGWNDFWLVQDGLTRSITTANSWIRIDDGDLFPPLFKVPNHAWAVGDDSMQPQATMLEAEDGRHNVGEPDGDGWLAGPAHGPGKMLKGPPFRNVPGGDKTAEFRFRTSSLTGPAGTLVRYGVFDLTDRTVVVERQLLLADFEAAGTYQPFRMNFQTQGGHHYVVGCISQGVHDMTLDKVILAVN